MRCAKCATKNPEPARFCMNCGARLTVTCPECETELPPLARFCFACGTKLAAQPPQARPPPGERPPGPEAIPGHLQRLVPKEYAQRLLGTRGQVSRERRTVTILFSDVKGSTAMAESLDPEDVMEIMDGAFDVLIKPIYRYEGTVARLMGDAVLAFFGAPIAHEDDAQRACFAALDIVAGARDYAARLEEERGIQGFNVRVGIHTGLVVVGEVGSDLRVEYTAMGDAVNLAARMETAAEPGTVLITETTHRLIAPLFETKALGRIEVKGRSEAVPVYRVLACKSVPGKVRGIAGLESPLVGREAEFTALQEAVECLQQGSGGIVTVAGEAGIGKSRLVAEMRVSGATHLDDLRWVEGRCLSYGTSIAYLLWLDILRELVGVTAEDDPGDVAAALRGQVEALCPDQVAEVYPFLAVIMSLPLETEVETQLRQLDGQQLKAGTLHAAETLLAAAASQRPLVLVGEDLHWADPTSIELLQKLLPLTQRAPLLFVCVFRPRRDHSSWRLQETAARDYGRRHTALWLEPLSADQSERLVTNLLCLEHLPQQLKDRILQRAEGNPFYLEEVLRSLIDEGAIVQEEATGRWLATRDVADIAIPDTLQGVLLARIDRLQEETKQVLQMAAVIGRLFLYRLLAAIASEERNLDGRLLTLQQEEMIRERARIPELEYIFKHHLTQEAAYNGLLKKRRRAFHRQVAEALERLFPERVQEQVGLLAYHWEQARDAQKATEYLLQAGDQARLAYAHEEAVDFYQRALAFLEEMEEHERAARTQMKLGLTYDSAFDFRRGREAYQAGFALWQQAGPARRVSDLPPAPHALRLHWHEPPPLDPGLAHDDHGLIEQLFSGLVELTPELSIMPDVAASWDVLDGGCRYLFHLRKDIVWSDGLPVTAHDFAYAWQRVLDPATASRLAGQLYDIRGAQAFHEGHSRDLGVRALDDVTLSVELEGPTGYFLHLMSFLAAFPVPRHAVEGRGPAWADPEGLVTNGPFTVASWQPGDSLVLERYPHYHGSAAGNLDRVEISLLPHGKESGQLEAYEAGLSDVVRLNSAGIEGTARGRKLHATEYISLPTAKTGCLVFDAARPPFDDARVRRAFAHALNREWYVDEVWLGQFLPATGGLVPPGIPGHSPGIALAYDPERARELLAEAGYPGGTGFPDVEMSLNFPSHSDRWPRLVGQWSDNLNVSITIHWYALDWRTYSASRQEARPHVFFAGWAGDYPDPDNYLRVAVQQMSAWQHAEYLETVQTARRTLNQAERMKLYAEAERILAEEVPLLPLNYSRQHLLVKPWVRRYPTSGDEGVFWKDVIIEPH